MSLLAFLVTIPLGDFISKMPKDQQQPPKRFVEGVRLPGKPPLTVKDIDGEWQLGYEAYDVQTNEGTAEIVINMAIEFKADGNYSLLYSANWGNPPLKGKDAHGITVEESGTYKLSSDVLILDPVESTRSDMVKRKATNREPVGNEKHVFVVHAETKRIHLAGRCATFQVDPLCLDTEVSNVWFTLKGSLGKRIFGR
jgi:hypothetical protein